MQAADGQPEVVYADSLRSVLYGNTSYTEKLTMKDLDGVDYDRLLELYRERFSDASGFTFCFVGSVDMDTLRPYVEKYLASLPAAHRAEKAVPVKLRQPGNRVCDFERKQETAKTTITVEYGATCPFSLKKVLTGSILGQVLNLIYTRTIREEAGAAYSVGVGCGVDYYPEEQAKIRVQFTTSPEKKDLAVSLVDAGIREVVEKGPSQAELDKVKEYMLKTNESNRKVNAYWLYDMTFRWNHPGMEYAGVYADVVRSITTQDVQDMARLIMEQDNRVLVSMTSPADR